MYYMMINITSVLRGFVSDMVTSIGVLKIVLW